MFGRDWVGAGMLVYDFLLSMLVASGRVVSIMYVWVLSPYVWVRVVFRVLWMCVASSCVSAYEFATRYMCRLYLERCRFWGSVYVRYCGNVLDVIGMKISCKVGCVFPVGE